MLRKIIRLYELLHDGRKGGGLGVRCRFHSWRNEGRHIRHASKAEKRSGKVVLHEGPAISVEEEFERRCAAGGGGELNLGCCILDRNKLLERKKEVNDMRPRTGFGGGNLVDGSL